MHKKVSRRLTTSNEVEGIPKGFPVILFFLGVQKPPR